MKKIFTTFLFTSVVALSSFAQFSPYEYNDDEITGWDTSPYESYSYNGLPFRILFPEDYDSLRSKKYPLILFFHGAGETGTDNEIQLIHGGEKTKNAIIGEPGVTGEEVEFPGIALYPQHHNAGSWNIDDLDIVKSIVDELITGYNLDPNRIYIHGLSAGGEAVWQFAIRHPKIPAAMHPMSGAADTFLPNNPDNSNYQVYVHIPAWLSQGGNDNNPRPDEGNRMVSTIRDLWGGNIRYSYYPNSGHNTWNSQYNKPDFFSWFLEKEKTDILIKFGDGSFCEGASINVELGVTQGFDDYEWTKNDTTDTPIFTGVNEITVTDTGRYYVRFQRGSEWTNWSDPAYINTNRGPSPTPTITKGIQSTNLPGLDGKQSVTFEGPEDKAAYQWYKDSTTISGANSSEYTTTQPGSFTLTTEEPAGSPTQVDGAPTEFRPEPQGCESNPSNAFVVTTENGVNSPAKPSNFFANVLSENSIIINWDDNASNELGFELYRSTTSGNGYTLIDIIDATSGSNPQSYTDAGLTPNTTYYYRMRAVNNSGGSAYAPEVSATTTIDNEPPTSPTLSLAQTTDNSIGLSWSGATDNAGITEYDVYRNNTLIATLDTTYYNNTGLPTNQYYSYVVRAKDATGNVSPPSNQVTAATIPSGLHYEYYHHGNVSSVNQIAGTTLINSGNTNNFDISLATRGNQFAFIWEGYLLIETAGSYTFYTQSDDGSALYIDNNLVVDNDGAHGTQERSGSVNLSEGLVPIRVLYFENGGGQNLTVRWQGPGISKNTIPDDQLYESTFSFPDPPDAPSGLAATAIAYDQIDLTWTDNSGSENGFEIYRSTNESGDYSLVHLADANTTSWSNTGLEGSTTYYYQLNAINLNGASSFDGPVSATTPAFPATPTPPSNLVLQANSATSVQVDWDDNSSNETGFEVHRSTSASGPFTLIQTTSADVITYTDNQVAGNSTYYYKVRATGIGSNSTFTTTESITTPNRAPQIEPVNDRSVQLETTLILEINADDPDGGPVTFSIDPDPLPGFISFSDNGFGSGEFIFSPTSADGGTYPFEVIAEDDAGGSDTVTFTIIAGDNANPEIATIANLSIEEGFADTVAVSATDSNEDNITLTSDEEFDFIEFIDNGDGTGAFIISTAIGDQGVYPLTVYASDGEDGFAEESFQLTITETLPYYELKVNLSLIGEGPADWNNIRNLGNPLNYNMVSSGGEATSVLLSHYLSEGNRMYGNGAADLSEGIYPQEVLESFWFKPDGYGRMKFTGLNPSLTYDLTLFSGVHDGYTYNGNGPGTNRNTQFRVRENLNWSTSQVLNPVDNTTNTITFTGLKADSLEIEITNASDGSPYYVFNAMVLTGYIDDGQPPAAPGNLALVATSNSTVDLTWQDNSNNETNFDIIRSEVSDTGPFDVVGSVNSNSTSFVDNGLEPSTLYYYRIRAVNANGTAESPTGFVTTLNSAPSIDTIDNAVMRADETLIIPVTATDPEENDISLSADNLPSFGEFTDNGDGTGTFTFSPSSSDLGFYSNITVEALDNFGSSSEETFSLTVTDDQFAGTVYINFDFNSQASPPWNNMEANPSTQPSYSGLLSSEGDTTNIGLTVAGGWQGVNDDGLTSGNDSYAFEDDVVKSYWYTTGGASLTITGLDPASLYNIDLYSATDEWAYTVTDYTIGSITHRSNATNNSSEILAFNSLSPNGSGEIGLTLAPITHSIGSYINALVIKEISGTTPVTPSHFSVHGTSRTTITLSWQDNSYNETGFEIYRADEPGASFSLIDTTSPDDTTYQDGGHTSNDAFVYRIRAVSGNGNSDFTEAKTGVALDHQVFININSSGTGFAQAGSPWNNTNWFPTGNDKTFTNFTDEEGGPVEMEYFMNQYPNGQSEPSGMQTGDNSGIYPDNVLQGFYYLNQVESTNHKLTNLDDSLVYDITFLGSQDGNIVPAEGPGFVEFVVDSESKKLLIEYNVSETVTFEGIGPDENGEIPFMVNSPPGSRFATYNAIVVSAYQSPEVVFDRVAPTAPTDLVASNLTDTSLTLEWVASVDNTMVGQYEVYQNGSAIGTSDSTGFDVTGLSGGLTYTFTVRAFDINGNVSDYSGPLQITTPEGTPATMYYTATSGVTDISSLSSWGSNEDGTGTNPTDFSTDNQQFVLQSDVTQSTAFSISGASSRLIVATGVSLTLDANYSGLLEAGENATVTINSSVSPSFDVLDPTSTVVFGAMGNTIPAANYGNLHLVNDGSTKNFNSGSLVVNGTLTVESGVSLVGATPNASEISVKGDMIVNGTLNAPDNDQLIALNFNSGGTQSLTLDNGQDINMHSIRVSQNTVLTINPLSSTGTLALGSSEGGGLRLENGSRLNLGSQSLVIKGRGSINPTTQTGAIATSKGTIEFNSNTQSDSYLYFVPNADTLENLIVNLQSSGNLNLRSTAKIVSEVVLTDGHITIQDTLVLISDSNQTARIAAIENDGVITGDVEVQRFMEAEGRIYRYVSTPVKGSTVSDWQQFLPITGPFTGSSPNTNDPSLFYYDEPEGGWIAYPDGNNQQPIMAGRGYSIYTFNDGQTHTIRTAGEIIQGDYAFIPDGGTGGDDGWNLLGNPYPSPIAWNDEGWQSTDIYGAVYIRDNGEGAGSYRMYDKETGIGDPGFEHGYIASGQAFWVRALTSSPVLNVSENAKASNSPDSTMFFRTGPSASDFNYIRITLNSAEKADYAHLLFDETYSNGYEDNDILKLKDDKINFYTKSIDTVNKALAINKLSDDFCELEIPLNISEMRNGSYSFQFDVMKEFDFEPVLEIRDLLNSSSELIESGQVYGFSVNTSDPMIEDRFVLHISKPEIATDLAVSQTLDSFCQGESADYRLIINTQKGVRYEALIDGEGTGVSITGNGYPMELMPETSHISGGEHVISISGQFPNCSSGTMDAIMDLTIYSLPEISMASTELNVCYGESLELSVNIDEESELQWLVNGETFSNTENNIELSNLIANTEVMVRATNPNGCMSTETINIMVDDMETPVIEEIDGQLVASIENADSYSWYLNDSLLVGQTGRHITDPLFGEVYIVEATLGACSEVSAPFLITGTLESQNAKLLLYPNPTQGILTIGQVGPPLLINSIKFFNNSGKMLRDYKWSADSKSLDITQLKNGVYMVSIITDNEVYNMRIIKY